MTEPLETPAAPAGLLLECTPANQGATPGSQAIYVISIENSSAEAQSQSIEIRGLAPGSYSLDFDEKRTCFPGEQRTATLIVSVPDTAEDGLHEFDVVAMAGALENVLRCSLQITTAANTLPTARTAEEPEPGAPEELPPVPGISLSPALVRWTGETGEQERLIVTVRNGGGRESEYAVSLDGLAPHWYTLPAKLRIAPGGSIRTDVRIHPPRGTRSGDYQFRLRVEAEGRPALAAEADATLTVSPPTTPQRPSTPPPIPEERDQVPTTPRRAAVPPPEITLSPSTNLRFDPTKLSEQAILTIKNTSRMIDLYEIRVEGIPDEWYGLAASELRLDIGASQQVPLRLAPRLGPAHPAGEYVFRIRVVPRKWPDSAAELTGLITVVGVQAFDVRLAPAQTEGRAGLFALSMTNTGGVPLRLRIDGSDSERMCKFKFAPPPLLDPGQSSKVGAAVSAKRNGMVGSPETFDFQLKITPTDGETPKASVLNARFVHTPVLGLRTVFVSVFLASLVSVVAIIIAFGTGAISDGFDSLGCQIDDDWKQTSVSTPEPRPPCDGGTDSVPGE